MDKEKNENLQIFIDYINNESYEEAINSLEGATLNISWDENRKEVITLINLLKKIIKDLDEKVSKSPTYHKKYIYLRTILLLCNKILRYQRTQNIINLKKRIVDNYRNLEELDKGYTICSEQQVTELRITKDATYLIEKGIQHPIDKKRWANALYFTMAARLINPDSPELNNYLKQIKENIKKNDIKIKSFGMPKNKDLILDSNIIINYLEGKEEIFLCDLEKLSKNNNLIIIDSVYYELKKYIDFNNNKENIKEKLDKLVLKHGIIEIKNYSIDKIKDFYNDYWGELGKITEEKINYAQKENINNSLRKLAQRENLLPEKGDMNLLAAAIELGGENIGILSEDKDFINFVVPIFKNFKVEIYNKNDLNKKEGIIEKIYSYNEGKEGFIIGEDDQHYKIYLENNEYNFKEGDKVCFKSKETSKGNKKAKECIKLIVKEDYNKLNENSIIPAISKEKKVFKNKPLKIIKTESGAYRFI
jgi:hypothetical protein